MAMTFPQIPGYTIESLIAKGGMAKVYLAQPDDGGRKLALKVYEPENPDPRVAESFLHEAKMLSELHHINVVRIYEWGSLDNGCLYMAMEYLEGGDLQQRIKRDIGEIQALGMLIELAYVLQYVHNHGLIHCDIKPANILFRRDGSLVLTDFGIAKRCQGPASVKPKISATIAGSPDYCSPEQAQGWPMDERTDIYSAGLVFIKMLTGKNPFRGENMQDTLINQIKMDVPKLNSHFEQFQPLVDKMLAKNPDERFASMQECIDYINHILKVSPMKPRSIFDDIPVLDEEFSVDEDEYISTIFREGA